MNVKISFGRRRRKLLLTDFEKQYFTDDLIRRDNANVPESPSALMIYHSLHLLKREVLNQLRKAVPDAVHAHETGDIYIHKLPEVWYVPYCGGLKSQAVMKGGLRTHTTVSRPPRHLDSAIDQLKRAVISLSFERVGAVGLNDLPLVLAPFVRYDSLDYRQVKQCIQRFIFDLNNIERPSSQSPFTNISIGVEYSDKLLKEVDVYVDGRRVGSALDYYDEALVIFKALLENYLEGDAVGNPFTFPIPTVLVTDKLWKILEERSELWELFWKVIAVRGSFYFLNFPENVVHCFCCRLMYNIDKVREVQHIAKGVWYLPPLFGSINYVSINLPRIAFVSRDDNDLFENLLLCMNSARKVLNIFRARHEYFYDIAGNGMFMMTKSIAEIDGLRDVNIIEKFYYNTISTVGTAEAVNILILKNCDDYLRGMKSGFKTIWHFVDSNVISDVIYWYRKILEFMRSVLEEFEREDDRLYNLEQAPAETASVKLAYRDLETFGKSIEPFIPRDTDPLTGETTYFYTSQLTPYYTTASLNIQVQIESECQRLYTGGVIKILQVHTPFWSPEWSREEQIDGLERLSKLIRSIMSTGVVYLAFTPVQNHCNDCNYLWIGDGDACPRCGSKNIDVWSRIVGYYRPVRNWNKGRRAEFMARVRYKVL